MNVLMTSETFLPLIGGAEMHVWYLMRELHHRGHEVTLLTNQRAEIESTRTVNHPTDLPRVTRIPWSKKNIPALLHWLWCESKNTDVIHAHFSYRLAVIAGIVGRLRRIPVVVTLHGLGTLDEKGASWFYAKAHSFYRWMSLTLATRIISTSEDLALVAWKHVQRSKKKTVIIFNGVDTNLFHKGIAIPREVEERFVGKKVVMTVRRLVPKNGVHFLVEAFPRILKRVPTAVLVMLGGGRMKDYIEGCIKALGIKQSVAMLGDVENARVPGFVSRADVVVFPSTAESTSIACAEAMAMGKPIVASRIGGLIELLGANEERGRLVKLVEWEGSDYAAPLELPDDRYEALAGVVTAALTEDDSIRCIRARQFAEEMLDWDVITRKTIAVYGGRLDFTNKQFYSGHDDNIRGKRHRSKYPLRAYAHRMQYESVLQFVEPGMSVLDAGCGDGVLSLMMVKKGARVTGIDMSEPNIERARAAADGAGVGEEVHLMVGDAENLPFLNRSFDLVVSSHVLEHLPDFDQGLREVLRVTKRRAVVALPTLPNPCSLVQVGDGWFYLKGPRSFFAFFRGAFRAIRAWIRGEDGVDEGYGGTGLPHIFHFQSAVRERFSRAGARIMYQEASSVCLPYLETLLPLVRLLDRHRSAPVLKHLGYGTTYLIERR